MRLLPLNRRVILVAILVLFLAAGFIYFSSQDSIYLDNQEALTINPKVSQTARTSSAIIIGELEIPVELAVSYAEIQKGLSGRVSLDQNKGLLFIFSKPSIYRFWMPDMHFPIDIVWINDSKIVGISHDVPTTFDPAKPIFYYAPKPAQYVLEVNAGFTKEHGINVGDALVFKNINTK